MSKRKHSASCRKGRAARAVMGSSAREEWERFQRMSPAEQLEAVRFECPVGEDTAWERLLAQRGYPFGFLSRYVS